MFWAHACRVTLFKDFELPILASLFVRNVLETIAYDRFLIADFINRSKLGKLIQLAREVRTQEKDWRKIL
ncbi:MAG: hypothetical protein ACTSPD_18985 [Promethearchaeota archaeon]